jgi:hypothetical protein
LVGLKYSAALDDAQDQYHDGDDKQNMNQAAHRKCGDHAEHPKTSIGSFLEKEY